MRHLRSEDIQKGLCSDIFRFDDEPDRVKDPVNFGFDPTYYCLVGNLGR